MNTSTSIPLTVFPGLQLLSPPWTPSCNGRMVGGLGAVEIEASRLTVALGLEKGLAMRFDEQGIEVG